MQFISSLFGGSGNTVLTMLFALGAVIVLIVLAVWLLKVLSKVSGNSVRGRNRRLAVIDTLVIDQKRQLMIVRRDNVEHLILTGGAHDVVVETGIPVEETVAPAGRRPVQQPMARRSGPTTPPPVVDTVRPNAPAPRREPETLLDQLQQSGHAGDRKTRVSLRQTGLLRPLGPETGQNPDIRSVVATDSAKQGERSGTSEGAALEHDGSNEANRG
ncbi:flagellar biosynthetic protein FliO [Devosia chinhatensis]|uniref:Flagellar biosynthesis protein FliO n=1 Tax=Devosia chinhatensis TaxID=429727 RepID=A0A0F5FL72_9HYPH|nr:flagellar biosynthetic protein FliO [Devosia chinhatensis]KKB09533.1 hypothetical protein VE26_06415 [Devosia chinhatensis]